MNTVCDWDVKEPLKYNLITNLLLKYWGPCNIYS